MAVRNIRRRVTFTCARGNRLNALGEFEPVTEVICGRLDRQEAQDRMRREYRDDTIVVQTVEHDTSTYVLDFWKFLELATIEEN
jgi:hypothetical protein